MARCCQSARGVIKGTQKTESEVLEFMTPMFYNPMAENSKLEITIDEFSKYISSLLNPDRDHLKIADPGLTIGLGFMRKEVLNLPSVWERHMRGCGPAVREHAGREQEPEP